MFSSVHSVVSTLCDPRDSSLPGSSVYGISQARILEWVAISLRCPERALKSSDTFLWILKSTYVHSAMFRPSSENMLMFEPSYNPLVFVAKNRSQVYHLFFFCSSSSSVAQSCPTLCHPMIRSMPGLPVHHQQPESTQIHVYWVGDAIQPSHPLSSPSPPALNLSQHQGLVKWVSSSHQVAKVLGVSASTWVLPMNTWDWSPLGWTGWISLQSKGLLRVFSQHHSSKASILQRSAFFIVQLSHPYMTTGKTIALTRWTFVDKVMSLLFNMLSRLVITFLPRSKCL